MGIPELRFSLPISWAHCARSFSNCTSLRSRSSIFLRQSAMSIALLPYEPVLSREPNQRLGPPAPLLSVKSGILTQPLPHVLDSVRSSARSRSQSPRRPRRCQPRRTALESRRRTRLRSAVWYAFATAQPVSAHHPPTPDACP